MTRAFLCGLVLMASCYRGPTSLLPPETPGPRATTTVVRGWREVDRYLHVDVSLSEDQKREVVSAAAKWRALTVGRARIRIVFDLDYDNEVGLRAAREDGMVVGVRPGSAVVAQVDARHVGIHPLAETGTFASTGAARVYLLLERIEPSHFESIVMHEFGHVIGLPDLPELDAVMSSAEIPGLPVPSEFTAADVELCRLFRYCS